jgi:hypothetical protein
VAGWDVITGELVVVLVVILVDVVRPVVVLTVDLVVVVVGMTDLVDTAATCQIGKAEGQDLSEETTY